MIAYKYEIGSDDEGLTPADIRQLPEVSWLNKAVTAYDPEKDEEDFYVDIAKQFDIFFTDDEIVYFIPKDPRVVTLETALRNIELELKLNQPCMHNQIARITHNALKGN